MITGKQVAQLAGVSQATVSRVLGNHPTVAEETRNRVLTVLNQVGYKPNAAARTMRTRRSGTIGVVVERMANPFYLLLLVALGEELSRRDLRMVLWDTDEGAGSLALGIDALDQGLIDGVVLTTFAEDEAERWREIGRRRPVVLVNRVAPDLPCDQVGSENVGASKRIGEYLIAHGHTKIALVTGPGNVSTVRQRELGFRSALSEAGIELSPERVVNGHLTHRGGRDAITVLLNGSEAPTAVFCVNDVSGFGAIDGARVLGRGVPDDLWVVGFDNIYMADWEAFDLTTAAQPLREMVVTAVDLLTRRIDDPSIPTTYRTFWCDLVVRGSTAHAPVVEREKHPMVMS